MVLVILPVKNESQTIKQTVDKLIFHSKEYQYLFIDDNSDDETYTILKKSLQVKVIPNKFDNGKGSTLKAGYVYSEYMYRMKDNDFIVFMDGDGQIHPKEIDTFLKLQNLYDADIVIGNKRHDYSSIHYSLQRQIVSKVYNWIVRYLFGFNYRDTQCGIKMFKKSCLEKIIQKVNTKRYAFDLELVVALRENNFRIIDAPVTLDNQKNKGSVSFSSIISTFIDTLIIYKKKKKGFYRLN